MYEAAPERSGLGLLQINPKSQCQLAIGNGGFRTCSLLGDVACLSGYDLRPASFPDSSIRGCVKLCPAGQIDAEQQARPCGRTYTPGSGKGAGRLTQALGWSTALGTYSARVLATCDSIRWGGARGTRAQCKNCDAVLPAGPRAGERRGIWTNLPDRQRYRQAFGYPVLRQPVFWTDAGWAGMFSVFSTTTIAPRPDL